jgi:hypothetical protein
MSQPNSTSNSTWFSIRIIRIFVLIIGIMGLVVIPVLGYFLGTLIGIHMSASDVDQGYAYGGLLYTVYNATHNVIYSQEAQISQAQGISEGQTDILTLQLIGLGFGLGIDIPIVFLFVREFEKMDS